MGMPLDPSRQALSKGVLGLFGMKVSAVKTNSITALLLQKPTYLVPEKRMALDQSKLEIQDLWRKFLKTSGTVQSNIRYVR